MKATPYGPDGKCSTWGDRPMVRGTKNYGNPNWGKNPNREAQTKRNFCDGCGNSNCRSAVHPSFDTSVLCGGHRAAMCSGCPQGSFSDEAFAELLRQGYNGAELCNGDCVWKAEKNVCEALAGPPSWPRGKSTRWQASEPFVTTSGGWQVPNL